MMNNIVSKKGIISGNIIALDKGSVKMQIEITDIFEELPFLRYRIEYFADGKYLILRDISLYSKEENGEYRYFISFYLPKTEKSVKFNLQQVKIDEFGREIAVYYSFPIDLKEVDL